VKLDILWDAVRTAGEEMNLANHEDFQSLISDVVNSGVAKIISAQARQEVPDKKIPFGDRNAIELRSPKPRNRRRDREIAGGTQAISPSGKGEPQPPEHHLADA
jgi:hypothetical protein